HCWAALVGGTGGQHWWVGTGGWHWWAQVGGTAGHMWGHCWAQVGALLGNGWAGLVGALLGGTCGCHCWAPIIRALIISALMIGADPRSDNCWFSAVLSSRSDSVRKVQPRTGTC
ncbi:unnamed protein product, partial [Staurois parvus]